MAWYCDNSNDETHLVATKQPNELGLYDMSGNVYEWCQDWLGDYSANNQTNPTGPESGSNRVIRGGSWLSVARYCRSSNRFDGYPDGGYYDLGLRLVLPISDMDFNGDDEVNSADIVYVYNRIIFYTYYDYGDEIISVNGVTFNMVGVEVGTFQMGATSEQGDDVYQWEKPVHSVTLSSYKIGETEVTQALWKAVMGNNPSYFKGDDLPVECVSWNDCQEFIKKLNTLTGKQFRLPTEAEWEYACRGGNKSKGYKYSGSNNIDDVAWYADNSNFKTHTVATKQPNELGLYDMSGNVWEWCQDWYGDYSANNQTNPIGPESGTGRVNRGGSWLNVARYCRSSSRGYNYPDGSDNNLWLRLVLP